jgi:hypothetical protein
MFRNLAVTIPVFFFQFFGAPAGVFQKSFEWSEEIPERVSSAQPRQSASSIGAHTRAAARGPALGLLLSGRLDDKKCIACSVPKAIYQGAQR